MSFTCGDDPAAAAAAATDTDAAAAAAILVIQDKTSPTVNLWRKWYHRVLAEATKEQESLKKVFEIIDKHSKGVQNANYILTDPKEDVDLARICYFVVLLC